MIDNRLVRLSKFMSRILRHAPEQFGVTLDAEGFTSIEELLSAIRKRQPTITEADIRTVVETVEPQKQRFTIVGDDIRANYGHSLTGKITYEAAEPPAILFHGTAVAAVMSILTEGLRPMRRQYVHLTPDRQLALRVGGRHGKPCLFQVDAPRAAQDGIRFYRSNPSFWLVDALPAKYLIRVGD